MATTSLSQLRVSSVQIPAHGGFPNTSLQHRPLLIYHSAFPAPVSPDAVETHLSEIGVVTPQWRYSMFPEDHCHSTTHEVLAITHGRARLCFGGTNNPDRLAPVVTPGDVVLMPAGVAHRLLEDLDGGFGMVGCYPVGAPAWDMCYGAEGEETKLQSIKDLEWFDRDPIYGDEGPAIGAGRG